MGMKQYLHLGLYIKVKPFEVEELVDSRECTNLSCDVTTVKDKMIFCSKCGTKIDEVEKSNIKLTTNLYEIFEDSDFEFHDYLLGDDYLEGIYYTNRYSLVDENFGELNLIGLNFEETMKEDIVEFEEIFAFIRSILGDDAFEVRYGLLQTYN